MNTIEDVMFPKTVAGITFTETGILIKKPYQEDYQLREENYSKFTGEYLEIAKRLAKTRMAHCKKQLYDNISNATHITYCEIGWDGGHFSVPVYENLVDILELTDIRNLNALQTQQLIRAMLLDDANSYVYDYDENLMRYGNEMCVTDDFKNFITEYMLCFGISNSFE